MTDKQSEGYWELGARRILSDAAGKNHDHSTERKNAARVLLAQFAAIAQSYGLAVRITEDKDGIAFPGKRGKAFVNIETGGWLYLVWEENKTRKESLISLNFNPITKQFEGVSEDPNHVPEPGGIVPRLSPLTVLAVVVTTAMAAPE